MSIHLMGEVGRSGRPEDVAIVQALLANIKGPNGRVFWESGIDGRPSDALAGAIEGCQRFVGRALTDAGSSDRAGVVRPGSRTLNAFEALAPRSFDGLRVATATSPVVLYSTDDPRGRAGRNRASQARVPGATIASLSAIQQGQALLADRRGLAAVVRRSGLAGDRWGFRVGLEGLTVVEADGRWRLADENPESIPAAVWRLVDAEFGFFEPSGGGDMTGPGVYRSRAPLPTLAGDIDEAVFPRMEVPRPARYATARAASAVLRAAGRSDSLSDAQREETRQLIAIVRADEPAIARLLEERWRVMQYGFDRDTLRYATNEQIRDYLMRKGCLDQALAVGGLLAISVGFGGPAAWASALADVLVDGAEENARRLYETRLKAAAIQGGTVAGQSVAPGRSRQEHLFELFNVTEPELVRHYPARFGPGAASRDRWLDRLLGLMERLLADDADVSALQRELDRDWLLDENGAPVADYVVLKLRRSATLITQTTNPDNARFRSDPVLAAYARRLALIKGIKDRAAFFALLVASAKRSNLWKPDVLASWFKWALEVNAAAIPTAREELMQRESAL
ncbi:hypothetical protein [Thalassobaculum sp.]|uniref:hypothetical protein n=1 Tax=Thalassobaculum sp. TaxID=2022740 RepID=UPI0032EFADBE